MNKSARTNLPIFVERLIDEALSEDHVWDDLTTAFFVPSEFAGKARVLVKAEGVISGLDVMARVFLRVDPTTKFSALVPDGARVHAGQVVAEVAGEAASLLRAERTALNLLQHLSGIATLTYRFVQAMENMPASPRITDTRKTLPGLRWLQKRAVRHGGGFNHRMSLADAVLIKDNHLAMLRLQGVSLKSAVDRARVGLPHTVKIEIEAGTLDEVCQALDAGADIILLDNMNREEIEAAVKLIAGRAMVEVSGGVNLENVREFAVPGVQIVSIGALTHSAPALDISLEFDSGDML